MENIRKLIILFVFLLISNFIFCQKNIEKTISIDSIIYKKNNYEKPEITSASGVLKKKVLGIFNRKIGGINWTINSIEGEIHSIIISKYLPEKSEESIVKYFYNNQLIIKYISYTIKYSTNNQSNIIDNVMIYFDNDSLINHDENYKNISDKEIGKIISDSKIEFSEWSLFIRQK